MKKTLVKFKLYDDCTNTSLIEAVYPSNVIETLQILKEVEEIRIENEYYTYVLSEFVPALTDEFLDVVYVYLDSMDYEEDDLGWMN